MISKWILSLMGLSTPAIHYRERQAVDVDKVNRAAAATAVVSRQIQKGVFDALEVQSHDAGPARLNAQVKDLCRIERAFIGRLRGDDVS